MAVTPIPPLRPAGLACLAAVMLSLPAGGQGVDDLGLPGAIGGHATGHVIVKVRPGVAPGRLPDGRWTFTPAAGAPAGTAARMAVELDRWSTRGVDKAFRHPHGDAALAAELGLDRYYKVRVPPGSDAAAMAAALSAFDGVLETAEVDGVGGIAQTIPNDTDLLQQYAMWNVGQMIPPLTGSAGVFGADINATHAWDVSTGSPGLTLATLDSGLHPHVEMSGRILTGWNVVFGNTDTSDNCSSHGTHVAGIAAATGNNGMGVAGVNWGVQLLPIRVLASCSGTESALAEGICFAVDNGADVINMSLQYETGSTVLLDAVQYAYRSDVPMVAAAGNDGFSDGIAFPGRWCETITVAATNNQDQHPAFSNTGPEVDVAAPGDDIYSTISLSSYGYKYGTSMATPHVSGLVALMLGLDPTLTIEDIRKILHETAVDLGPPGFDDQFGWGRIDAHAALLAVQDGLALPADANGDGTVDGADLVLVILAWGECASCEHCPADVNGDGDVDGQDLVEVILNWS